MSLRDEIIAILERRAPYRSRHAIRDGRVCWEILDRDGNVVSAQGWAETIDRLRELNLGAKADAILALLGQP